MDEDVVEAIISSTPDETDAEALPQEKEEAGKEELKTKMLELIAKCDTGNGCSYNELVSVSGIDEYIVESIVSELLEDGECFEPKPGKIKRL